MVESSLRRRNAEGLASAAATHSSQFADVAVDHPAALSSPTLTRSRARGPLLWGMGGTLLSGLGFIGLALFEQYNGMIIELRSDLKHFNEISADFVKKDSLQRLRDQLKERFKELEESSTARTQIETELRASERAREEMGRELQRMRERLAFLEGRQTRPAGSQPASSSEN